MTTLSLYSTGLKAPAASQPIPAKRELAPASSYAGLATRAFRWFQQKGVVRSSKKRLQMIETVSLGEKRFVALVKVDDRQFLIGGASTNVGMLADLGTQEPSGTAQTEVQQKAAVPAAAPVEIDLVPASERNHVLPAEMEPVAAEALVADAAMKTKAEQVHGPDAVSSFALMLRSELENKTSGFDLEAYLAAERSMESVDADSFFEKKAYTDEPECYALSLHAQTFQTELAATSEVAAAPGAESEQGPIGKRVTSEHELMYAFALMLEDDLEFLGVAA